MKTRYLVDPEFVAAVDGWTPYPAVLTLDYLLRVRAELEAMAPSQPAIEPSRLKVSEQFASGTKGAPDVRVFVYQPKKTTEALPGILWMHPGGYMIGSVVTEDAAVRALAAELGCVVVSVDYRLAPENPHPAPIEDCYTALRWLNDNAADLGVDRERLAVGGLSAGAGLAAALALLARDRGEVHLAFQMLDSPMLDDRTVTLSAPHPYTGEFIWTPEANRFGWSALLGQEPGTKGITPYAAAARSENLQGLPPAFISVGALDLFLEEDMEFARRLTRAGVPTELHVYPGVFHGYQMVENAQISRTARRDQMHAFKRALNLPE